MMTQVKGKIQMAKKDAYEGSVVTTAHSLAALLKEELRENYRLYELNSAANLWPACPHGAASVGDFLSVLSEPVGACRQVIFSLNRFRTLDGQPLTLANLVRPAKAFEPVDRPADEVFKPLQETVQVTFSDFNVDPARNAVVFDLRMASSYARSLASAKVLKATVDLARTINPPKDDPQCKACRASPGSVCCGGSVGLLYLANSGKIKSADFDRSTSMLRIQDVPSEPSDPLATSVKISGGVRHNYRPGALCLPVNLPCAASRTPWVIDACRGGGSTYFLTSHGYLYKDASTTPLWTDPKIQSISYFNSTFYLLRTDGQILAGSDIADRMKFYSIDGFKIPEAAAIAQGDGPSPIP